MNISKPELRKLYLDENLTIKQISDKLGASTTSVFRKLKKYGIEKENSHFHKKPLSKELLVDLYINQGKSMEIIGQELGVNRVTVSKWLKASDIPIFDPNKPREIPSLETLNGLYVIQGKTLDEMGELLNANRNLISKWLSHYGIEIRLFGRKIEPPTKEILQRLYLDEKLTIKQISELYGTNQTVIRRWFVGYSIPTRSNQRKYYHLRGVPLTDQQREFIVGTMLGDGHLQRTGKKKSVRLAITHCEKQLDYLLYKRHLMQPYVNAVSRNVEKKRNSIRWSWASIYLNDLRFYHKLFYDNTKKVIREEIGKYLTPFGMAIWVMDDGWRNHSNIRISSEGFDKSENETLARIIKLNFDVRCKVCEYTRNNKQYYYLSFNKENSIKLTKLIEPYVLPTMRYKLVEDRSSTTTCQTS